MNDLITRLRLANDPTADVAADHIATLSERVAIQQTIMDSAASILVEAIASSNGIDEAQAEACIASIRGKLADIGKTTAEHYLELICDRIAATAGIGPQMEFNPLTALDQIRIVLHAQRRTAERLEWAMSVLWTPADSANKPHLVVRTKGTRAIIREFGGA
ncbi:MULTISPECIES: hypothetical protein [Massilia]|uniref:hypothetical protein n=1 Tax=Massilia TaxID=149698 RepID=UPI00279683E2|nr:MULTISPECIES: hypothetical protein [unclassified Massilia]MDQ1835332.1 hypothetical protein [Massilia sp. CCM 9029]MDQ1924628.1 hypothetical protein [Massilia sp. CCM 9206]